MSVFRIKNETGATLTLAGQTVANGSYANIPYILNDLTLADNKLWGSDAGRSLGGDFKGSIVGHFPTLTINIGGAHLTPQDVSSILKLTRQETVNCKYVDDLTAEMQTKKFYFDSVTVKHKYIKLNNSDKVTDAQYDSITIQAIPISKG